MQIYIGTKIVKAEPMEEHMAGRDATIEADGHSRAGYRVVYEDGYVSWSPKDTFERAYRLVTAAEAKLIGGA